MIGNATLIIFREDIKPKKSPETERSISQLQKTMKLFLHIHKLVGTPKGYAPT